MLKYEKKLQTYIGQMVNEAFLAKRLVATQTEMVSLGVIALTAKCA